MIRKLDFFNIINKRWATYKDVMRFKNCTSDEAITIMQQLKSETKKRNLYMPKTDCIYVPMGVFIDYFQIDRNLQERYHNSLCEFGYI